MRRRSAVLVFFVVGLVSCAGPEPAVEETPEADPAAARAAVETLINRYIVAANANDPDTLLSFTCDDLEAIAPGQAPMTGADAHQLYRSFFEPFNFAFESATTELVVSEPWAFRRYAYDITLTPKAGGDVIRERGYGMHVFRQQSDGTWCVAKDIWNSVSEGA